MDCISRNGNIFYASSLDSAQVFKGKGRGKNKCARARGEDAQDRELQLESNENRLSPTLCVQRPRNVHVAPIYPQASLVALPTDVKQKSYTNSRSPHQRQSFLRTLPALLPKPSPLSFPMYQPRKLYTISALDPCVIPSRHTDMAF